MPVDPKDPRLSDPKFQEFEDLVGFVMDKRESKRKEEEAVVAAKKAEEDKKSLLPSWFPW